MFAAQALARDMIAAGRTEEVEQIRRSISGLVPDLPGEFSDADSIVTEQRIPAMGSGSGLEVTTTATMSSQPTTDRGKR